MKLFFRELGEGQPIIILHGLFGSSDNWLSIGKILSEHYKVYLVDQRNHGQSPHSEAFDYPTMANDLEQLIENEGIVNPIIVGHSMGGKVAMEFAVNNPDAFLKLVVVDIAPKSYPVHHDTILEGLNSLDLSSLKSRTEADKLLIPYIPEVGVRQFLLKNLSRTQNGFNWKINLDVITERIEIIGAGLTKMLESPKSVLFIRGGKSNYVKNGDFDQIRQYFPKANIETMEDAGHWLHAEKPKEFMTILSSFIK